MNEAALGILITANDQATPALNNLGKSVLANTTSFRQLAMGVSYLGTTLLGLGVALGRLNDPMAQSIGQFLMFAGGMLTAVSSAVHLIYSISQIIKALKALQIQQMLTQAFTPGVGWAALAAGAVIAGGVTAYAISQNKSNDVGANITIPINLDSKKIAEPVRRQIVLTQQRNQTSGIR